MTYMVEFLKSLKFFSTKTPSDVQEIALSLLLETFEDDEMIFDQGAYGDKFYIILKGEVGIDIMAKKKMDPAETEQNREKFQSEKNVMAR